MTEYGYRLLNSFDSLALHLGRDILPKCPNGIITPMQHVRNQRDDTQFISGTKELFTILDWGVRNASPYPIIKFPLSAVDFIDCSTEEACMEAGVTHFYFKQWAKTKREVLITGRIPIEACSIVVPACGFLKEAEPFDLSPYENLPLRRSIPALWEVLNELGEKGETGKIRTIITWLNKITRGQQRHPWTSVLYTPGYQKKHSRKEQ